MNGLRMLGRPGTTRLLPSVLLVGFGTILGYGFGRLLSESAGNAVPSLWLLLGLSLLIGWSQAASP